MNELKNIIDFYSSLYSLSNDLWNIYIVVSVALAGFIFSKNDIKMIPLILLTLIYFGFAVTNQGSLFRVQTLMYKAVSAVKEVKDYKAEKHTELKRVKKSEAEEGKQYIELAESISASSPEEIKWFHRITTFIVILLFWCSFISKYFQTTSLTKRTARTL